MKEIDGREQGTWAHPALFEIGRALDHCENMRMGSLGPCKTRTYMTRQQWCRNCVAREALTELGKILEHAACRRGCGCDDCVLLHRYIECGEENERKHGLHLER